MTIAKLPAWLAAMAAVAALNAPELCASPLVSEGWDTAGNVNGWTTMGAGGVTLDNSAQYLGISFAAETVPLPGQDDIIRTGPGSDPGLTGDYAANGIQAIGFRFLAQDYAPNGLALYFGTPTRVWSLALTASTVGEWDTYQASLDYSAGWVSGPGADAAAFASDLSQVDWVGVHLSHNYAGCDSPPAQTYGLDDFAVYTETPEPATCVLLVTALVPLMVVFRGKFSPRKSIV